MESQLTKLINHKIIVQGPSFLDKEKLESVTLVGVDDAGIWIQSPEALDRLVEKYRVKPSSPQLAFFIPWGQITAILADHGENPNP